MEQAIRESQINATLSRLDEAVDRLHKTVESYIQKTHSVLLPEQPKGTEDKAEKQVMSPLTNKLSETVGRIGYIMELLNDALKRNEL